MKPDRYNCGC